MFLVSCAAGRIERAIAKADELRGTQQYETALRAYELIVLEYPTHPKCAEVLLRIGDLYYYSIKDIDSLGRVRGNLPSELGSREGGTQQALPVGGASSGFAAARSKTEGFAESMTRAHVIDQAIATYQRIVTDWSWQAPAIAAHRRLAEISAGREDYTTAIEYNEQLLKYFPAYEEWDIVRHAIGVGYLKQKQYVQARIEFQRLLEQDKVRAETQTQTLYDLAETFVLEGKPEAAIPYYNRLIQSFPKAELAKQAKLQLVQCYGEAGKFPEALALAQALRREYPDDPVVRSRLKQLLEDRATVSRPGQLPWGK